MKLGQVFSRAALLALLLVAGACQELPIKPDPALLSASSAAYADLVARRDQALIGRFPDDARAMATPPVLDAMRSFVPDGQAGPGQLVGWHFNESTALDTRQVVVRYDYPGGQGVVITTVFTRQGNTPWQLLSLNILPASQVHKDAQVYGTLAAPPVKTARADS